MWSHAATLGTRYKNGFFTIDKPTIENFIRVFKTGYPQKVCVDYEHGDENDATDSGQPFLQPARSRNSRASIPARLHW
jgi:hypothetical protein